MILLLIIGPLIILSTLSSALSTFVLPRAARSRLNRFVFSVLWRVFAIPMRFARTFYQRDALLAYYAPVGLMMLVPTWYFLVSIGYALIYFALGFGDLAESFRLSGSSLLTLGIVSSDVLIINVLMFSEAVIGLILVALLISYLPTMYAAFSRREQAVTMLEVRAGDPPSVEAMLSRFNRIHGLESLHEVWKTWEIWFSDIEESHSVLPALVFFRSPRPNHSWVTSAGAVLDTAALTLAAIDIPFDSAAALCIRSGFLALRQIVDYFDVDYPRDPHFPADPISVTRTEFESTLDTLAEKGLPVKADREQAWLDFAGWRVNYDYVLLSLCTITLAPTAPWSADRAPQQRLPRLFLPKRRT